MGLPTYAIDGVVGDVTIQGPGPQASGGEGGLSTGIGVAANSSGASPFTSASPFGDSAADFEPARIGGGSTATSASNLGSVVNGVSFVAGTGYTNGTYDIDSDASGGRGAGEARVRVTVTGGAITSAIVTRCGQQFTSAPTFTLTALGAGTGGSVTATIGTNGRANALGAAYGGNKGVRYVTANAAAAVGAAVPPSTYLNRSPRAMAIGDKAWCVAP